MFRNYFITAWRNLIRNRWYSTVNILGLAVGMSVALLIGLWVQYQYSFDRWVPGYQQIAQVHTRFLRDGEGSQAMGTPLPLTETLQKEVPGIQYVAHTDWMGDHGLTAGEHKVYMEGAQAGEDFFKIFRFPAVKGNPDNALQSPYNIVLTESISHSLFGTADPMGKKVRIDNQQDFIVAAVIKDLPATSTFRFSYVLPFGYDIQTNAWVKNATTNWNNNSFQTFVALTPAASFAQVEASMAGITKKYAPEAFKESHEAFFLHPMRQWHLYADFRNGQVDGGFIEYVRLFSIIGVLVLLIACINFMNLSTARSEKRAREVGVRKAIGSLRRDLIIQFLLESMLITVMAALLCLLLVELALPSFNLLTSCQIYIPWRSPAFWGILVFYITATGLLAGSRPAFYLSSFKPVKVLKGSIRIGRAATLPRKLLVVLQFTCSIALIISTGLIDQQIQHAKDRPIGYNADRLILLDGSPDLNRNYTAIKQELLASRLVDQVTKASSPITTMWNWSGIEDFSGRKPNESLYMATVDVLDNYFDVLGMHFVAGRNFSGNLAADTTNVILNEAAVRRLRFKDPINKIITWRHGRHIKVIGVVKDALMLSPFTPAEPTFFTTSPGDANNIMFRLSPTADIHTAMARLMPVFNTYNPAFPVSYHFADESYAEKFTLELLVGRLAGIFATLAILISCLGLLGLASYMAEQRTREIGLRKVLGASVAQLWFLLSRDFILLVVISSILASPIAFSFLHSWLQKYSYRITIGPAIFFEAAAIALLITLTTISIQAIRAALANPTRSLRAE